MALACGLFLTTHLRLVFKDGLTAAEYETARTLMLLMSVNLALSFPMGVFGTIISANERFIFLKIVGMINIVIGPLVNLPLLLMGYRSVALVVSSLAFSLLTAGINFYYVVFRLHNRFRFSGFDRALFRSLFTYTAFIAINLIVDQINNGIDKVLLGRYVGTAAVAVYAVGANLYGYYKTISSSISGVFTPRIHRIYNAIEDQNARNRELTELFIRIGRIQFLILMLVASCMVIFGQSFIGFWVGDGYRESYYVCLLLMIPASIPLIQNIGIEIQRAANMHQFRSAVYGFMAVFNLAISIYLCQLYGAIGATLGTSLSIIFANGIVMNLYYYRKMGLNIPAFWRSIMKMLMGMLPAFAVGFGISKLVKMNTLWVLLLWIAIYTGIYGLTVWCLSMNTYEKSIVKKATNKASRVFGG